MSATAFQRLRREQALKEQEAEKQTEVSEQIKLKKPTPKKGVK